LSIKWLPTSADSRTRQGAIPPVQPEIDPPVQLIPASAFTIEQLVRAYNQTRVDYLVPMPMNAARLTEYIYVYDVDMDRSVVAVDGNQILGLAMLGVRPGRVWVTRLGVLPVKRRRGIGEALMHALLVAAEQLEIDFTLLEVIKNNTPAHSLFLKLSFQEVGELLILRRPPAPPTSVPPARVRWFDRSEALALLNARTKPAAWTNEIESFENASGVLGLSLTLPDGGGSGWLVFQARTLMLQRLTLMTQQGDPRVVGHALLAHLYQQCSDFDTHTENIPVDDPHVPALFAAGFVESFRRIEMHQRAPQRAPS